MPQLIAEEIFYYLASYGVDVGVTGYYAVTVTSYAIVAAGSYAAAKSMQKIPNMAGLQSETAGRMQMVRDTVASRRVIYGTVRVSGPIIFASTTSNTNSTKNENLHLVLALASHQCGGLKGVFLNDVRAVDESGTILSPFTGNYEYSFKFGTPTQTAFVMDDPAWTSDHKLSGICAIYSRMVANPNVFPNGIPNITAVVQGYDVPDMNDNPISGCTNPALILRHYLLNYFKADANEIDVDSFTTAADICDEIPSGFGEKRYECNYTFTLNTKPQKVIEDILKTCYGKLAYVNGKFVLKVGAYTTPVISLNEDDIIGNISVTTKSSQANAINSVRGIYVDGASYTSSYQPADFVPVTSSYYLNEDGGFENPYEVELSGVINHTQARRIAKITLLDSRQDMTVNITCKIGALRLIAGDTVYLNIKRYGWENKVFQIMEMNINPDLTIGLVLKETASTIYDFPIDEDVDRDLSPNTSLPNPFIVSAPVGFSANETTIRDKDGTIFPAATLTWSGSLSGSIDETEIEYRETSSLNYNSLGTFSRTVTEATTLDVTAGETYDFRIRALNYLGTYSPYASASLKIFGNTVRPQPPSGSNVSGSTGNLFVTWINDPVDTDYKSTKIYVNTSNASASAVYQGSIAGTTWNKTIAASGSYYVWLKNTNTSNLESDVAYAGNSFVSSISDGGIGPSGSAGPFLEYRYVVYDTTPTISNVYSRNPTGIAGAWVTGSVPNANGSAVWVISANISGDGTTVLSPGWQGPSRFSGNVTWYKSSSQTGSLSPITGDWVFTTDTRRWYRWNGSSWVDSNSLISLPDFPSTFQPVSIGNSLPTLPDSSYPNGSTFCVTTTGILYRNNNGSWTAAVTASNLTGTITSTQIASGSITTPLIFAGAITGDKIAANSITSSQIVANSITTGLIAAGALTASHVGTNTLIANTANIKDLVITSSHIIDLYAGKLTAGTINAAIRMTAGEITGSGYQIVGRVGLRSDSDDGILTITGGTDNGDTHGAQLDLLGNSASVSAGVLNLVAGNVGSGGTSQGFIQFYTGGNQRGFMYNSGRLNIIQGISVGTAGDTVTNMGMSANFGSNNCLAFAGGTGATGVLCTNQAHRWVNQGNSTELMALNTSGDLYANRNMYASAFIAPSTRKLKDNIVKLNNGLDTVKQLEAVSFTWKFKDNKNDVGLIAEDVKKVIPDVVSVNEQGEAQGIDYAKIVPYLIASIQEQQEQINELKKALAKKK